MKLFSSLSQSKNEEKKGPSIADYLVAVVAPLKYVGPYACLGLRFPDHNATLGFLLDTGANVNSIDARVAKKLNLRLFRTSDDLPPVIGTGGAGLKAGDLYQLGDCQLDGLPPEQTTTFVKNLTAAALPYASPVGHGLLGLNFFMSFPAGVEFDWYGTDGDPPTTIFYYGKKIHKEAQNVFKNMTRVPLKQLDCGLLSLTVNVNGVDMPAILDTGSPITVLNQDAAKQADIDTVPLSTSSSVDGYPNRRQQLGDEALKVAGVDGGAMDLYRSKSKVPVSAGDFSFGDAHVYVGDLPGLKIMAQVSGLNESPAVVLGLDSLKQTYRMILRAGTDNEVWFEALGDQILADPIST